MSTPDASPPIPAARHVAAVSARCNNACRFCAREGSLVRAQREPGAPTSDAWRRGLDAAGVGASVVLSGGEPMLLGDLLARVEALREAGAAEVWVQTNGRMLAYRRLARSLAEAGATGVECALHGHEPALHDWLTRVEGSFRQAVAGARNARRAGLRLVINTTLVRSNFRHVPAIVALCRRLPAERLRVHPVRPEGAASRAAMSLVPPRWLAARYLREARRLATRAQVVFEVAGPWAEQEG